MRLYAEADEWLFQRNVKNLAEKCRQFCALHYIDTVMLMMVSYIDYIKVCRSRSLRRLD